MTNDTPDFQNLIRRLDRVERQNTWFRGALSAAVLVIVSVFALGAFMYDEDIITARALFIVDEDGRTRAAFGTSSDGDTTALILYGDAGTCTLSSAKEHLIISIGDGKTERIKILYDREDDLCMLGAFDNNGKPAAALICMAGERGVELYDKKGKERLYLYSGEEINGLVIFDKSGRRQLDLGGIDSDDNKTSGLKLYDAYENLRSTLGCTPAGTRLIFLKEGGKEIEYSIP